MRHVNEEIKAAIDESGIEAGEFFWLMVRYFLDHEDLYVDQRGIRESPPHLFERLWDEWTRYHDLPEVYRKVSQLVLEQTKVQRQLLSQAA